MPNTGVTKLVTHRLANPTSLHHCDGNIVVGVSFVGCRREVDTSRIWATSLLPAPFVSTRARIRGHCIWVRLLSGPLFPTSSPAPPLLLLLTKTSARSTHWTGIQDRRCSLRVTLADWFPFLGAVRAPWPVQVFPAADTGQYCFFLASGIWPVLVFLSVFPFSVLIMASTGFLIFCGFPEYWFSYRWFFL